MNSSSEEAEVTSIFAEIVSSVEEGESAINEKVAASIDTPDPSLVPDYDVAEIEGEECGRRALEELEVGTVSRANCVAEATIEKETSLIEFMGRMERDAGVESKVLTFAGLLQREDLISETPLENVVDMHELPLG